MSNDMPSDVALSTSRRQPTDGTATEVTASNSVPGASASVHPIRHNSGQPRHWNPEWSHFVLHPKSEGNDGVPIPRRPTISLPDRCGAPEGSGRYEFAKQYWDGIAFTWDEATRIASGEDAFPYAQRGPKDFGLSPYLNGLVVLDCDVKNAYGLSRPVHKGARGARFGAIGTTRLRGIDDLAALCATLGHDLSELATYTVRTPSGGLHLYFHQSFETPITVTSHHRDGWLIDVIASENNWVAAPPTPRYRVVCDYPVATMPDWLAEALTGVNDRFEPVGGKKRSAADKTVRELRQAVVRQERTFTTSDSTLIGKWVAAQLQLIRVANDNGCWNLTIFQVTKDLARFGWDYDSIETVVLAAAQPWSTREERDAIATIRSGWNNLRRNSGR